MTRAGGWTAGSSQKRPMLCIGWRPVRWGGIETAAATVVTYSGSSATTSPGTGCRRNLASGSISPQTARSGTRGGGL